MRRLSMGGNIRCGELSMGGNIRCGGVNGREY